MAIEVKEYVGHKPKEVKEQTNKNTKKAVKDNKQKPKKKAS